MQTAKDMREQAERCIQLARRTGDDRLASALLAYASELEQRAHLLEGQTIKNSGWRPHAVSVASQVAAER
jgi:hypothetical protein